MDNTFGMIQDKHGKRPFAANLLTQPIKIRKLNQVDIANPSMTSNELSKFSAIIKAFFKCSKCHLEDINFKQCSLGHLFCLACVNDTGVFCEQCAIFVNSSDLSHCTIPATAQASMTSTCSFCHKNYFQGNISTHERDNCPQRMTQCKFSFYGCPWSGMASDQSDHKDHCQYQNLKVKNALEVYKKYKDQQKNLYASESSLFKNLMSRINTRKDGLRLIFKEIVLYQIQELSLTKTIKVVNFQSSMIQLPFSCCHEHGFYMDFVIGVDATRNSNTIHYILRSESNTRVNMVYCLLSSKLDFVEKEYPFIDQFHKHSFQPGNEEAMAHEISLCHSDDEWVTKNISVAKQLKLTFCALAKDINESTSCEDKVRGMEIDYMYSLLMSTFGNMNISENPATPVPTIGDTCNLGDEN